MSDSASTQKGKLRISLGILSLDRPTGVQYITEKIKGRVSNLLDGPEAENNQIVLDFLQKNQPSKGIYEFVKVGKAVKYTYPSLAVYGFSSLITNVCRGSKEKKKDYIKKGRQFDEYLLTVCGIEYSILNASIHASYVVSVTTEPQEFHFDYDTERSYEAIKEGKPIPLIGIISLTQEGTYLELVEGGDYIVQRYEGKDTTTQCTSKTVGRIVFIPYAYVLILPSTAIHAGGYKTGRCFNSNLRLHFYILPSDEDRPIGNQVHTQSRNRGLLLDDLFEHHLSDEGIIKSNLFDVSKP